MVLRQLGCADVQRQPKSTAHPICCPPCLHPPVPLFSEPKQTHEFYALVYSRTAHTPCRAAFTKSPDIRRNPSSAGALPSWTLSRVFSPRRRPRFLHRRSRLHAAPPPARHQGRRQARSAGSGVRGGVRGGARGGAVRCEGRCEGPGRTGPLPPTASPCAQQASVAMSGPWGAAGPARQGWLWGAAALLALGAVLGAWRWVIPRRRRRLQRVGTVLRLFVYPVKSCRGVSVRRAQVTPMGLRCGDLRDR